MVSAEGALMHDFEKYLKKKKHKIGNGSHGFSRGQHDLILQIIKRLKKLKKQHKVK
jgi:hypothetical protein